MGKTLRGDGKASSIKEKRGLEPLFPSQPSKGTNPAETCGDFASLTIKQPTATVETAWPLKTSLQHLSKLTYTLQSLYANSNTIMINVFKIMILKLFQGTY